MKKEIALLAANLLEAGCYIQCRGQSRLGGKHCIVGVIVDLYERTHPGAVIEDNAQLPRCVLSWADIHGSGMDLISDNPKDMIILQGETFSEFYSLRGANDDGVPFSAISEWLRKNYELI